MAKLRKFCAYRRLERPYTRTSKYRKKSFIRVRPHSKIVKYNMGDTKRQFESFVDLLSKSDIQIRHNSIESARLACNRFLEKNLGKTGFYFEIRAFPHHILRENPLASGAGADRMSTGMKKSFGKPVGSAFQARIGSPLFTIGVQKKHLKVARQALKRASKKLPCSCLVQDREKAKESRKSSSEKEEVEHIKNDSEIKESPEKKISKPEEQPKTEEKPAKTEPEGKKAEKQETGEAKPEQPQSAVA